MAKPKVKVVTVVQVDNRRFSTVGPCVDAIAWSIALALWDKYRMKYPRSENYDALDRMTDTATRRVTPIIQRVLGEA